MFRSPHTSKVMITEKQESSTENRQGPSNKRKIKSNQSFETARDVLCRRAFVVGHNFQGADFVKVCFKVKKNRHYLKEFKNETNFFLCTCQPYKSKII